MTPGTPPARCGIVRVVLTGILGVAAALFLPDLLGLDKRWGAAGLTASAGIAGWVEFALLRRGLCRRLGQFNLPTAELLKLWSAAIVAGVVSTGIRLGTLNWHHPILLAAVAVSGNAIVYLLVTSWWDIPEAAVLTSRVRRVLRFTDTRR